jgi:hypothetical protein
MAKKIKIKKLQLKRNDKFNPFLMVFFAAATAVAGYFIIFAKAAPPPPTVYLTPATQTVGPSSTITVQVRENSGTTAVNAVQANFSYPASLLTFVSIDTTTSAFTTAAQATGGSGQVSIARGIVGSVVGDQLVATVTFTANTTSGSASLAFTSGTALVSAQDPNKNQDILGSLAATGGATYIVDATAPTTSITAPANNATLPFGNNVTISASASDASSTVSKVEIYVDSALKTTLTTSPYNYTWTGATLGAHTIFAKAYDSFNNVATTSTINATVADQSGPTVSLTAPAASAVVSGASTTISSTASDNVGVAGVQFKLDGANLGAEDATSPYSMSWNTTTATNGTHSITAVARDAAGNTTTSTAVSVTVDNGVPTVSITSPTGGSNVSGTTAINATAADNTGGSGLLKVEFYVDGTLVSSDTTTPYSFSWNTSTYALGAHSLTAKAYDNAPTANVTTSSAVNVTVVDATPPSAPTSLHATGTTLNSVAIAWTASTDNVGVTGYQVKRNGTTVTTTASLSYNDTGLSAGTSYSYTVVAVDAAGNTSTAAGPLGVSTPTLKPGDLNHDNVVDLFDLSILLSNWGSSTAPQYDINANGTIDIFDLSILLTNYGT